MHLLCVVSNDEMLEFLLFHEVGSPPLRNELHCARCIKEKKERLLKSLAPPLTEALFLQTLPHHAFSYRLHFTMHFLTEAFFCCCF